MASRGRWTNACSIRDAERVTILVVEPDGEVPARWRFGRVAGVDDPLEGEVGTLEERNGRFHLVSSHPDAITALLLVTRHGSPTQRLVYDPAAVGASPSSTPRQRAPERVGRVALGRSKGGGGETLAERAERLARREKR